MNRDTYVTFMYNMYMSVQSVCEVCLLWKERRTPASPTSPNYFASRGLYFRIPPGLRGGHLHVVGATMDKSNQICRVLKGGGFKSNRAIVCVCSQ